MGTNTPEMKQRAFEKWLDKQRPERIKELERSVKEDLHRSLASILEEFGISKNASGCVCPHFGVDAMQRKTAHQAARSIKCILDKIKDVKALEKKIRGGVLTSHDVRRNYALNYEQWRKLLDYLGITYQEASDFYKDSPRGSSEGRSHIISESLTKDGTSLEWLTKSWSSK